MDQRLVGAGPASLVACPGSTTAKESNPEELLAAAHADCFSMALSLGPSAAGHPPSSINTTARIHLRLVGGAPAIQQIDPKTETDVPGLDQEEFQDHAERAKTSCIISVALGGRGQINLSAHDRSVNQAGRLGCERRRRHADPLSG